MKQVSVPAGKLPVMEHFFTIQGEGFYQGKAAYFIRLGGCDVGCTWCDVKESWDRRLHPLVAIERMVEDVVKAGAEICVITGGEPFMHHLGKLTALLRKRRIRTHVETSGAYPITGKWHWICLSPKRFKAPLPETMRLANELKVVVYHKNDFRFAEKYAALVGDKCRLYLQPEWSLHQEMLPLIIDYVKKHQRWEISLQLHKYLNVP